MDIHGAEIKMMILAYRFKGLTQSSNLCQSLLFTRLVLCHYTQATVAALGLL